jgi:predicted esterase
MSSLHDPSRTLIVGTPLETARAAMILLHGRGGSAADMSSLATHLAQPGVAFLVPEATGNTWYPQRYLAPLAQNEPWLGSALALVGLCLDRAASAGVARERVGLLGFSQGACLALEFLARHPGRHAVTVALSGALIGPPGERREATAGRFSGSSVLLGIGDRDGHVELETARAAAELFRAGGATVDYREYAGMGHTINEDELQAVRAQIAALAGPRASA